MALGSLQKALVNAGIAEMPKEKNRRHKTFKCRKCGALMEFVDDTNIMYCSNPKCNNFYIFTHRDN